MGEITKEDITPEYIAAIESDLELLKSKEPELSDLVNQLRTAETEIKDLSTKIDRIDQIGLPRPNGVLSLDERTPWDSFVDEFKRFAQKNEERTKLESELGGLNAKQKEITAKIIAIVPARVRYYKPQIKASAFTINVYDEGVSLIR